MRNRMEVIIQIKFLMKCSFYIKVISPIGLTKHSDKDNIENLNRFLGLVNFIF